MSKTPPKTITVDEVEKLLLYIVGPGGIIAAKPKRVRDAAMILLMVDAGLRVGELVQLLQSDLWFNDEPVHSLLIRGEIAKRHHERIVPLSNRTRLSIAELHDRVWLPPLKSQYIFAFYTIIGCRYISTRQAQRIVARASLASIGRAIHPHILRHTFASRLMRKTNIRVVQQLLGHKQLSSTQIYTHPNHQDLKEAVDSLI